MAPKTSGLIGIIKRTVTAIRVIFMQTNREDVEKRYLEIEIPIAPAAERVIEVSKRSVIIASHWPKRAKIL